MSEVKRYDISCFGGMSMDECGDGTYVNYEDYEALEAKCSALAAENAGLKSKGREVLNEACKVYDKFNANVDSDCGDFMDGQTLHEFQFLLDVETPATDAFLDEVRAQGVDSAINRVIAMMNHQHPVTSKAIDIMRVHAYQIRKGGVQK